MPVLYQQIYRDGKPVSVPFEAGSSDVVGWFHKNVSYSMDHAVRYEGFEVRDLTGPYYVTPLGDVNLHTPTGAKLIAYSDEMNPGYTDPAHAVASRLNQWFEPASEAN